MATAIIFSTMGKGGPTRVVTMKGMPTVPQLQDMRRQNERVLDIVGHVSSRISLARALSIRGQRMSHQLFSYATRSQSKPIHERLMLSPSDLTMNPYVEDFMKQQCDIFQRFKVDEKDSKKIADLFEKYVKKALYDPNPSRTTALILCFGLDGFGPRTDREVAELIGGTPASVRYMCDRALRKFRSNYYFLVRPK